MGHGPAGGAIRGRRLRQPERPAQRNPRRGSDLKSVGAVLLALTLGVATEVGAQELSLWLEATGTHAQPPADVTGEAGLYGLLGARVRAGFDWGATELDTRMGNAVSGPDSRWIEGTAALQAGRRLGPVAAVAAIRGFALRYLDPFDFDARGIELIPSASVPYRALTFTVAPRLSVGRWDTETLEGDLRVAGATIELARPVGSARAAAWVTGLAGENGVSEGAYWNGGARVTASLGGRWTGAGELSAQRSPLEEDIGGVATLSGPLGPRTHLRLDVGRTHRDPLFGTPGTFHVSLGLSVEAGSWEAPGTAPVAAVGEPRGDGRAVTFTLRAGGADRVELAGDFTGWEPVAMEASDGGWTLTRVLEPGLHHFGFLVDGQWALPPDAPGVVDDGWGRKNASIVVEP